MIACNCVCKVCRGTASANCFTGSASRMLAKRFLRAILTEICVTNHTAVITQNCGFLFTMAAYATCTLCTFNYTSDIGAVRMKTTVTDSTFDKAITATWFKYIVVLSVRPLVIALSSLITDIATVSVGAVQANLFVACPARTFRSAICAQ